MNRVCTEILQQPMHMECKFKNSVIMTNMFIPELQNCSIVFNIVITINVTEIDVC